MKHFASALVAATAAASHIDFPIVVDGDQKLMTLTQKEWSSASFDGSALRISANNSLFMQNPRDSNRMFQPLIRGGSIEYDVDVSSQNSGCVAGVYLVNTDSGACGEVDQDGNTPMCKSIDVMQANLHGFESKANPCSNGTCDAVSQCIAGMQQQGIEDYGVDAYGPGGRLIDTNNKFHVINEFVSTQDYYTFWKLKTTLKQQGNEIVLENDCRDYLSGLNEVIEGDMGIVFSSWDNTNGIESFELDQGQSTASTCDDATSIISRFSVKQYGSRQDIPDEQDDSSAEEGFLNYTIRVNGAQEEKFLSIKEWTHAETQGAELKLGGNSSVFLRQQETMDSKDLFTPFIRGGSIRYDVNLSQQESGCVAGVYLLDANDSNCGQVNQNGSVPQCKSIDAMQANLFGFETKAHPCSNGTCDAISQCIVGMQKQGAEKYGAEAYGPSGTIINTQFEFNVFNEFVSTDDYETFWKLRTTLTQDNNEIMMEADCRDYLSGLNDSIEGDMSFIFANWDNTSGSEQFELDQGQSTAATCENSQAIIKNFSVSEYGSKEDMPPAPEPEPVPTNEPLPFQVNSSMYGGDYTMWVKGLAGQCLTTEGSTIEMSNNNRAWVNDVQDDTESAELAYYHNYLGGSMEYDVDLSQVDCACASSMYLVNSSDENCGPKAKDSDERPQCSRVEIMEANKSGFSTASYPCEFGVCSTPKERRNTDSDQYGPSDNYTINTSEPFKVNTRFFAPQQADGTMGDLMKIETCLIQADRMVVLVQDDEDYLYVLSDLLKSKMAMVLSNYDAGIENEINDGQCTSTCGEYKSKMSNFKFTEGDSIFVPEPEDEMVVGELAENIDDCDDSFCSQCNVAWWAGDEDNTFNTCTDYTRYKYTNVCSSWQSKALCGDDDLCFKSYPIEDPAKWKSDDYACRPLPDRMEDGDFKFGSREQSRKKGLCGLGDCDGTCHMSWPIDDEQKWKSADAMVRCKN